MTHVPVEVERNLNSATVNNSLKKAVVIGAGIGGIAAAIRLAKLGLEVKIFESNAHVGGKMNNLVLGDWRFDMGPSIFTGPEYIKELFDICDEDFNCFKYQKLKTSFNYFFPDGKSFSLDANVNEAIKTISNELDENPDTIRKYLEKSKQNYKAISPLFIEQSLHKLNELLGWKLFKALFRLPKYKLGKTMNQENANTFLNPKTIQLFNRFATYNGSDPYQAPAMLNMIQHLEINEGIYFPEGGMVQIAKYLEKLAVKAGVQIHFNERVEKIETLNNQITGIQTSKTKYPAEIVVSNMDVSLTYRSLLPNFKAPDKILNQEKSSSAIVFYWGIRKKFENLTVHNMIFSHDYQKEFESIFKTHTLQEDPSIYINITSKVNPSDAPNDGENWFVMLNVCHDKGQDWEELIRKARATTINSINQTLGTNIEKYIEEEFVMDPIYIKQNYSGVDGSIYGNASNNKFAAFYRHPNFNKKMKGLYFAGVTVHPGGGIPLALNSAKIAVNACKKDFNLH